MMASKMISAASFSFVAVVVLALTMMTGARAEADEDHVYNTFARCTDLGTTFEAGYTITSFRAELEMDTHVDTYIDHYNYVAEGTGRVVDR